MKLYEIFNADIPKMDGLKYDIIDFIHLLNKREYSLSALLHIATEVLNLIDQIHLLVHYNKKALADLKAIYDNLEFKITAKSITKDVLLGVLRTLYGKNLEYLAARTYDLEVMATNNDEARDKIQNLAFIIKSKTSDPYVSDYSSKIVQQTAVL